MKLARKHLGLLIAAAVLIAIIAVLAIVSPWASKSPDSIEIVARQRAASGTGQSAPMKDYQVPGVTSRSTGTRLAGLLGAVIALAAAAGIGLLVVFLNKRRPRERLDGADPTAG